jgi:hypothetical protein
VVQNEVIHIEDETFVLLVLRAPSPIDDFTQCGFDTFISWIPAPGKQEFQESDEIHLVVDAIIN